MQFALQLRKKEVITPMKNDRSDKPIRSTISNCLISDMEFSIRTELSLRDVGVNTFSDLTKKWNQNSLNALDHLLTSSTHYSPRIIVEISIKLAFANIDVSDKLSSYIEALIAEDVQYSEIRLWKSLKLILQYLPTKKYRYLNSEMSQRYGNHYTFLVNHILQNCNFTVGEIVPNEDYFEVVCPTCKTRTSFHFSQIFSSHCRYCSVKKYASRRGFDAYTAEECEGDSFYDDMEDSDIAFVCKLCQNVKAIINLGDIDFIDKVNHLKCTDCEGEKILSWLADSSGNKISFENNTIFFYDTESGETASFSKSEFSPSNIWHKVFETYHSSALKYTDQSDCKYPTNATYSGRLQLPLRELPLSQRIITTLENAGIYTLEDILDMRYEDVIAIPNLGRKSCEELFSLIKHMGIDWNTEE